MAQPQVRSIDFLPEIFQTPATRQFLAATLDQLIQEPKFKKTQGFVGQTVGPGVNPNDDYVTEPTKIRSDYQLEPGLIIKKPDSDTVKDAITYPGMLDALTVKGANTYNNSRLFESDYYSWDPFVDFDKFTNFSQYYWLPQGPDSVTVSASTVPIINEFDVTRTNKGYTFPEYSGLNPVITLVRGGNYTFNVNQANQPFWIQSAPGVNGRLPATPNMSSRGVLGVTNNGTNSGTITFNVPQKTAQNFYYQNLTNIGTVDLVTNLKYDQINNVFVDDFIAQYGGIDGIRDLNNRTLIFQRTIEDPDASGWLETTQFDPLVRTAPNQVGTNISYDINGQPFDNVPYETITDIIVSGTSDPLDGSPGAYDTTLYDQVTGIIDPAVRYSIWQINYTETDDGTYYIKLVPYQTVGALSSFTIKYGTVYSSTQWFKNQIGYFEEFPLLSAVQDVLYYQDSSNPSFFGEIRLIDLNDDQTLYIEDILGRPQYTSPNGVKFTNGLKVQFEGYVWPSSYQGKTYYVEGVGTAIQLLPVQNYVTPETYTQSQTLPFDTLGFDVGNFDANLNAPDIQDYMTINRASPDLNAWSRSNRWFHIQVILDTAEYNNLPPNLDNTRRARRPILEFRSGLNLWNYGTQGKQPINIIDFTQTDALSNVNGTIGYNTNGYTLVAGTRIVFAADADPQVRNKIYTVEFIVPDGVPPYIPQPVINLVEAPDAVVLPNQSVVCLNGVTLQGITFKFDGIEYIESQEKVSVNQPPLFDIYDSNGISLGNNTIYPSSSFIGTPLFSYATGSGTADDVLGFPLRYLTINNVGDIVFNNNLYKDTFYYVVNASSITANISIGTAREYASRTEYTKLLGWQRGAVPSCQYQQFKFTYDGSPLKLDIVVNDPDTIPPVKLYVGSKFQEPGAYTIDRNTIDNTTVITLLLTYVPGDVIEVLALSPQVSQIGFYQIPMNLENNPFNGNSSEFTLGSIRKHYESIGENLTSFVGPINGANNSRDLGNIVPYGLQILQQSSPLTLGGYFLRTPEYEIFSSLNYNSQEYIKFKSKLLYTVANNEYSNMTTAEILDSAVDDINQGKTSRDPFYWSDMLPSGNIYISNTYIYNTVSTDEFNTVQTYNFNSSNYQALLVFLNNVLLVKGYDYEITNDAAHVRILVPLVDGDVIEIREFSATYGNFVPNTPTKMGLYPAYKPKIFLDDTFITPRFVIQGHDGSITVAFGDFRDQVLLEFETRIYDNLKVNSKIPITTADVIPGAFRPTGYSKAEVNAILSESFLSWVAWNKLDFTTQTFYVDNEFTWNYSSAGNKLNGQPLIGGWRGAYLYFYDTISPNTTPWEMLGFSEEPIWWESRYGTAPYTSGNLVLWDDLEIGLVADPAGEYILPQYARPGLSRIIPAGTQGELLSPFDSIVGAYVSTQFKKSWSVGDVGPVEGSWINSSSYPFAVMRLFALTRPAEFFALFADRDLYKYNADFDQYLYNDRYRLDASGVQIYGNGVSKASYINWIVDYNRQLGHDSTSILATDLASLDVRLCYRMASFTDKQYLKIYLEKSNPNSTNSSLLLPDDSYNLLLYRNQPFGNVNYSSVVIQKVGKGYSIFGYSTENPYFSILVSKPAGATTTLTAGGKTVTVPIEYTNTVAQVPYGYVFTNETVMADFLLSYGALLKSQGLTFTNVENGYILDWPQMAQEFLYWVGQGWGDGSLLNLNPSATQLVVTRDQAVVDNVIVQTPTKQLVDQNRQKLQTRDAVIERIDSTFKISSNNAQTISFIDLQFTSYENILVLDNVSTFNDLIYDPVTASRQARINLVGWTTTEWNGQVNAQGFIFNEETVNNWTPNKKYAKGEIVIYKNNYWSAQTIVQPKELFDYNDWVKSDYTMIQKGMLPNLANKANQLQNSYNVNSANLERDNDLLSYGLIGFRPREYMQALNLDDVSQVNVYKQFLKTKGTLRAVQQFSNANLGKESAEYNVYENWAVQQGVYGANANRSYIELRLDASYLKSDPSIVQVIEPGQESVADQAILLSDVWKESYKLTSTDIFPTTYTVPTDKGLPSAGYVDLDDVDLTLFDLTDRTELNQYLDEIKIGTKIWVAKVDEYNWNIYRTDSVPGYISTVTDNLNGTSTVTFTKPHGLVLNQSFFIKYFSPLVDGVYNVLAVTGVDTVTIAYQFTNDATTIEGDEGIALYTQTMRISQPSDIVNLPYANQLVPGARVWIDTDSQGHWLVLEKQDPFTATQTLTVGSTYTNEKFGSAVAQARENITALVGAPGYSTGGALYVYQRSPLIGYVSDATIELNATDTVGFGNAVDIGNQSWALAGASLSRGSEGYAAILNRTGTAPWTLWQILIAHDQPGYAEFGNSVTVSADERWMYVGAPSTNAVYAYGRVDVETQRKQFLTDGQENTFYIGDAIQFNADTQLSVVLNNQLRALSVDYTVNGTDVVFIETPEIGQVLSITRLTSKLLDNTTYYNIIPTNYTLSPGTGAVITVDVTRGSYNPTVSNGGVGYIIPIPKYNSTGSSGTTFKVDSTTGIVSGMIVQGPGITAGQTVVTVVDSTTVTLSAPPDGAPINGRTYAFCPVLKIAGDQIGGATPANDLYLTVTSSDDVTGTINTVSPTGSGITTNNYFPLNDYFYTVSNIYSFTVYVNGTIQRPHLDYEFNSDSSGYYPGLLEFLTIPPAGAEILVKSSTYYEHVKTITTTGLPAYARFGQTVSCTTDGRQVIIGAPYNNTSYDKSGSVYVFDRSVQRYNLTDPGTVTFTLPTGWQGPVSVILNNVFLTNTADYINGQFTVSGSTVVISDTVTLNVGDVLEIESNIFTQLQKLDQYVPTKDAYYGWSADICNSNCSIYIGAPNNSGTVLNSGSVERQVNQAKVYGVITSTIANPALTAGDTIRINNMEIAVPNAPNNNVTKFADAINASTIPNVVATVVSGYLTLSVKNYNATAPFNRLNVLPGTVGTAFTTLGFKPFVYTQTIESPAPAYYARFGEVVNIDTTSTNLTVGAPNGSVVELTTFDSGTTYFDGRATPIINVIPNSGVVYTYDYFESAEPSVLNPGKFVFGQQIYTDQIYSQDKFGSAINYTSGILLVGSPGHDAGNSGALNYGSVSELINANRTPAWVPIRTQQPTVDVALLNSVYMYDRITSAKTQFFDFINPLQGKILGVAQQNIDFIGSIDPANYNVGTVNNFGNTWSTAYVGQIWWNTNKTRFLDPNQDDLIYASKRWGQLFPGSVVEIYQWIASTVPPASYTGEGTVYSTDSYSMQTKLSGNGTFETIYYYWVKDISTIDSVAGKTLSTTTISRFISNPRSSGLTYIAPLSANAIAIYNGLPYINASDSIINVEYDREYTDDDVHVEYELIPQDLNTGFVSLPIFNKLLDSFCGADVRGNLVPDPTLSPASRYGVEVRPRQSMFVNRFKALQNYIEYSNSILLQYPISENRSFNLLNSSEPEPSVASGTWNKRVANLEELTYQNLNEVPVGYKYLVVSDSSNSGLWTIYSVTSSKELLLIQVQNYDTKKYWNYVNWYLPGYNSSIKPVAEVPNYSGLATLNLPIGVSVEVTSNSAGKFEIYRNTVTGWERVGLQDGTIQISATIYDYSIGHFGFDSEVFAAQYFDQEPTTETRQILKAINEELFIGELLIERNRALVLMFNYILSEQIAPEWLTKTSLIDVTHKIRDLVQYQIYRKDNQDFVLDYINEVKPYHVQIREFNLVYNGLSAYTGDLSDFDVPSYYNTSLVVPQYTSPVLTPYTMSGSTVESTVSDASADSAIWSKWPYSQWYNNHALTIGSISITYSGSGYITAPTVVITGDAVTPAQAVANIDSTGKVVSIDIIDPGSGYITTPTVTIEGSIDNARAYPIMSNDLVRSIKTSMKYDRYQYSSTIQEWQPDVTYDNGEMVRYNNIVWQAASTDGSTAVSGDTFDPTQWQKVQSSTLTGVDRTMGFYTPTANQPGLSLPLLIDGVEYPGVQVQSPAFDEDTGFDVGNFDINPYDNIFYSPEGFPTYDPGILDATISSAFTDPYLGTRPADINVVGGAFIDQYSSYAPEELIPGSEFDTLDLRVYTRPGADWAGNGHGPEEIIVRYVYDSADPEYSYANLLKNPIEVIVSNQTSGLLLHPIADYTIDWVNQTVTVTSNGAVDGDVVVLELYGLGGGNQLYKNSYVGNTFGNTIEIPVAFNEISELAIFVNGIVITDYTYESSELVDSATVITFATSFTGNDRVSITAIGPTEVDGSSLIDYSWSTPQPQYITADSSNLYELDNSMQGTNLVNMIVSVNGVRARPPEGIEWIADGSTDYLIPNRGGYQSYLVYDSDVIVYVNGELQTLFEDYQLEPEPYDPGGDNNQPRSILFYPYTAPQTGSLVQIYVTTKAQYIVYTTVNPSGNTYALAFVPENGLSPSVGDSITVTTFNDDRQLNPLTLVFQGPVTTGVTLNEPFDSTDFDIGTESEAPGSFDYTEGDIVTVNDLDLTRIITDPNRLYVTLNGRRLFANDGFTLDGEYLILASGVLSPLDVVSVTMFTNSVVPDAMAFRIFQDMRGVQATYRITDSSTTELAQLLLVTDEIIYLVDASAVSQPIPEKNIWGVITINGERIMYRSRDLNSNTISSLLRGTAGTAIAEHQVSSIVYDMGRGNLLPVDQDVYTTYMSVQQADGVLTSFTFPWVAPVNPGVGAVNVYVGGVRLDSGYTINRRIGIRIEFDVPPPTGADVYIVVRTGQSWYQPGINSPSDGIPLQEQDTVAARFLRGS